MRDFSSSLFQIGTITTCTGAKRGGKLTPLSSPWAMTRAPISRVLTPHEVDQTSCRQGDGQGTLGFLVDLLPAG